MSDKGEKLVYKLDVNRIKGMLLGVVKECNDSLAFGLEVVKHFEKFPDKSPDDQKSDFEENGIQLIFGDQQLSIDEKKERFRNWVIRKGFEDLIKAVNLAVIEAYFQIEQAKLSGKKYKYAELVEKIDRLKKESLEISNFPQILKKLGIKELKMLESIQSINKVRNCLVHRDGVVVEKDFNDKKKMLLRLEYWNLELVYLDKDKKETTDIVGAGMGLMNKKKTIEFKYGERIHLHIKDFKGCAMTCQSFGEELTIQAKKIIDEIVKNNKEE